MRQKLADNFDTQAAMKCILDLVKETNTYINNDEQANSVCPLLLENILTYVQDMLRIFGFTFAQPAAGGVSATASQQGTLQPRERQLLEILLQFRASVRKEAVRSRKETVDWMPILKQADNIREELLPSLGIVVKVCHVTAQISFAHCVSN